MKKVLLSIVALFTVVTYASAQDLGFGFGPKVGVTLSNVTKSEGNYKVGLTAGVFADYRFSERFALSADVMYARQGNKVDDIASQLDYLNVPILANVYLVKGLSVKAGIQPGFLLGAKVEDVNVKNLCESVDLSIPVGISYQFDLGLILDARYNIGVTNVIKEADVTGRNSAFSLTAGWRF